MKLLETERLILRNWCDDDLDIVHRLNSDEAIMKFFPFRRDRQESRQFLEKSRKMIEYLGTDGLRSNCEKVARLSVSLAYQTFMQMSPLRLPRKSVGGFYRNAGVTAMQRRRHLRGWNLDSRPLNCTRLLHLQLRKIQAQRLSWSASACSIIRKWILIIQVFQMIFLTSCLLCNYLSRIQLPPIKVTTKTCSKVLF